MVLYMFNRNHCLKTVQQVNHKINELSLELQSSEQFQEIVWFMWFYHMGLDDMRFIRRIRDVVQDFLEL